MSYSVKQLSALAGVSTRTLHYYDQVGLLKPEAYGPNGYRVYGSDSLLRLQQILFFKELEFSLKDIQKLMDSPDFDVLSALKVHRAALQHRAQRLEQLMSTVDRTIDHLKGNLEMKDKEMFAGFHEENQPQYEEEIRKRYGSEKLDQSKKRWESCSEQRKEEIKAEGESIQQQIFVHMSEGAASPQVQLWVGKLHKHMGNFYDCSLDCFEGLGHMYNQHPDFIAMYQQNYHPDFPAFLEQAVVYYCQNNRAE